MINYKEIKGFEEWLWDTYSIDLFSHTKSCFTDLPDTCKLALCAEYLRTLNINAYVFFTHFHKYKYEVLTWGKNGSILHKDGICKTYNEALEAGIIEGIKLIE